MYSQKYRIRYGDLDSNMCMTMETMVEIFQDISVCHSTETGFGLEQLKENGVAWLLQGWRIKVLKKPKYPIPVTVRTGVTEVRTVYGYRNYEVAVDDEILAIGKATWFMLDIEKGRPCRVKENITTAYDLIQDEYPDFEMIKLKSHDDFEEKMRFEVLKKELDTNNHLNNVKSFQLLTEIVPDDFDYNEISITYRKSAVYKDIVIAGGKLVSDNCFHAELRNEQGEPCVITEFYR